jgi:hypothetical protein
VDTVVPGSRREVLRKKAARAQNLLQRAASTASVHGDPVAGQLQAILYALGTMTDIHDAIFAMQAEFLRTLKSHSENVTNIAPEIARASAQSIAKELGPQLLKAALPTIQLTLGFMKQRAIFWRFSPWSPLSGPAACSPMPRAGILDAVKASWPRTRSGRQWPPGQAPRQIGRFSWQTTIRHRHWRSAEKQFQRMNTAAGLASCPSGWTRRKLAIRKGWHHNARHTLAPFDGGAGRENSPRRAPGRA